MHVVVLYPLSHIMLCYGGMLLLLPPPPPPPPPPPRWHIPTPPQSIGNCVRYYYLSKKSENFKQSIRVKKRRPTLGKPQVRIQYPPSLPSSEISCTSRIHFLQDLPRLASPLLLGHSKTLKSLDSEMVEQAGLQNSLTLTSNAPRSPNKLRMFGERKNRNINNIEAERRESYIFV